MLERKRWKKDKSLRQKGDEILWKERKERGDLEGEKDMLENGRK